MNLDNSKGEELKIETDNEANPQLFVNVICKQYQIIIEVLFVAQSLPSDEFS